MTARGIELLWFDGCPNHETARALLADVVAELMPGTAGLGLQPRARAIRAK